MSRSRLRAKGRRESGPFVPFPCSVLNHPNFTALSTKAVKLLMDMASQLRFSTDGPQNNGDISVAWTIMHPRGWRSKETLRNALKELEHYGFVNMTRQGGRHKCSLYALTWWAIDECQGKLDVAETRVPSNDWKEVKEAWKPEPRTPPKSKVVPRLSVVHAPTIGSIKQKVAD